MIEGRARSHKFNYDPMDRKTITHPQFDDYRKFVVWRILFPYLINIRKCSANEASNIIRNWLDK